MKALKQTKFFLFLFLFWSPLVYSQNYYINSNNGLNGHDGRSPSRAWKNLYAAKNFGENIGFKPGDQILLQRGGIWDERLWILGRGEENNHVVYGAYGEGEKPIIKQGFYHREYMHRIVPQGINGYVTIEDLNIQDAKIGVDIRTLNNVRVKNVKISFCETGIILASESGPLEYWVLEDIVVSENKSHGIFCYSDVNYLTVRRLTAKFNGKDGAAFRTGKNNYAEDSIAYQNGEDGFDMAGFSGDFSYIRCRAWKNKSAGFSVKAKGGGKATGNILYCISYNNFQGLEVGNESNSNILNSVFYNNSLIGIDLESSFHHSVKNCIIYDNGEKIPERGFQISLLKAGQTLDLLSNCYGVQSKGRTIYLKAEKRFVNLTGRRANFPEELDVYRIVGDPNFMAPQEGNFALQPYSICVDSGVVLEPKFKYGIDPGSSWVQSVKVLDQNSYGAGWEIGAHVSKGILN